MPKPREHQISLLDTEYYNISSRVVRKAFLCGLDVSSGKSYEHRRKWVEDRILLLAQVYSIDICAFAVMHNHLHIVLHVDVDKAKSWSMEEVVSRWHKLFKGTYLTQQYMNHEKLDKFQMDMVEKTAEKYRKRLIDISWFMRSLNEPIARRANKEDKCTGRFWEGRFKSQALLDETALLACMAYVDLNPIRAQIAKTPEQSEFTSIRLRIKHALRGGQPKELMKFISSNKLHKIDINNNQNIESNTDISSKCLCYRLEDYLELVDSTGRIVREDKRGAIDSHTQDILTRLQLPSENWIMLITEFGRMFKGAVGTPEHLSEFTHHVGLKRRYGISSCQKWLNSA